MIPAKPMRPAVPTRRTGDSGIHAIEIPLEMVRGQEGREIANESPTSKNEWCPLNHPRRDDRRRVVPRWNAQSACH